MKKKGKQVDTRSLHERIAAPLDTPRVRPQPAPKKRRQETPETLMLPRPPHHRPPPAPISIGIIQPFVVNFQHQLNMQQMFPKFTNMMQRVSPHFVPPQQRQIIQPFMSSHELMQYREQRKQQKRTPTRPRPDLHYSPSSSSSRQQVSFRSPVADLRGGQFHSPSVSSSAHPLPRDFWAKVSTLSPRLLLEMRDSYAHIGPHVPHASLCSTRKLGIRPAVFADFKEYCAFWEQFCLEEVTSKLRSFLQDQADGLRQGGGGMRGRLIDHVKALSGCTTLDFEISSSSARGRVGNAYLLSFRGPRGGRLDLEDSLIAVVSPQCSDRAARLSRHDSNILCLSVNTSLFDPVVDRARREGLTGSCVLFAIDSLISDYRRTRVTSDRPPPSPPFLAGLLGSPEPESASDVFRDCNDWGVQAVFEKMARETRSPSLQAFCNQYPKVAAYIVRNLGPSRPTAALQHSYGETELAQREVLEVLSRVHSHLRLADFDFDSEPTVQSLSALCTLGSASLLNSAQQSAMYHCLAATSTRPSSLTCVQGPPGCGKTTFLSHLLTRMIELGVREEAMTQRVDDLCAHKNKRKRGGVRDDDDDDEDEDDDQDDGMGGRANPYTDPQRVGTGILVTGPSNKAVFEAASKSLQVLEMRGESLATARFVITGDEERYMFLQSGAGAGTGAEGAEPLSCVRLLASLKRPSSPQDIMPGHSLYRLVSSLKRLRQKIKDANRSGALHDATSAVVHHVYADAMAVSKILQFLGGPELLRVACVDSSSGHRHDYSGSVTIKHRCNGLQNACFDLKRCGGGGGGGGGGQAYQAHIDRAIACCSDVALSLQGARNHKGEGECELIVKRFMLKSAAVIFSTLSSCGTFLVYSTDVSVETVIVDEAAQASEPDVLVALARRPKHLILVGDPSQLGCHVESRLAEACRAGESLMSRLLVEVPGVCRVFPSHDDSGSGSGGGSGSGNVSSHLLDTQYRMHEEIAVFPSTTFYAGRLSTHSSVLSRLPAPWWQQPTGSSATQLPDFLCRPLTFVHCSAHECRPDYAHGFSNLGEASIVVDSIRQILEALRRAGTNSGRPVPVPVSILVISFYQAQCDVLRRRLEQEGLLQPSPHAASHAGPTVTVSSVDGVQGGEADIVFVSFVRSNFDNRVGFLKDYKRLNVALTRARQQLVLVGNAVTLGRFRQWNAGNEATHHDRAVLNALAALADDLERRKLIHGL